MSKMASPVVRFAKVLVSVCTNSRCAASALTALVTSVTHSEMLKCSRWRREHVYVDTTFSICPPMRPLLNGDARVLDAFTGGCNGAFEPFENVASNCGPRPSARRPSFSQMMVPSGFVHFPDCKRGFHAKRQCDLRQGQACNRIKRLLPVGWLALRASGSESVRQALARLSEFIVTGGRVVHLMPCVKG